ncbi:ribulose-phosphate 3-epimerase [Actinomyces trachealis]|uniref:ribulose-phosphate 3-epimerase n=1 Tax=Actinomyces trachealis TaxID=2763540 RepID=UPI001892AB3B|nr:ribulose-phosphate 3-epimerase [Actinomyces trachealis]
MSPQPTITPSILNCDIAHLAEELDRISNADGVHVDVMDNHFVPNLSWGLPVVEAVTRSTKLPIDVHLMIEAADRWAPAYAEAGCQIVTPHVEACQAPIRLAREIHRLGAQAGLALRPATPLETVDSVLGELDLLLIMTVEPGFGGQSFIEAMLPKIKRARALISERNLSLRLQVDGGVSRAIIERAAEAGADTFVAGSAVYQADDAIAEVAALRALAYGHHH